MFFLKPWQVFPLALEVLCLAPSPLPYSESKAALLLPCWHCGKVAPMDVHHSYHGLAANTAAQLDTPKLRSLTKIIFWFAANTYNHQARARGTGTITCRCSSFSSLIISISNTLILLYSLAPQDIKSCIWLADKETMYKIHIYRINRTHFS